ncbi:hypothetical protein M0802_012225 [Mischocyttarus mexicanus]|nr:hypothetical protein M0802_012225 [Mischocyttarus mexicanus]
MVRVLHKGRYVTVRRSEVQVGRASTETAEAVLGGKPSGGTWPRTVLPEYLSNALHGQLAATRHSCS